MATAKKTPAANTVATTTKPETKTSRARNQDRTLVAGQQEYEVSYVARVTGTTAAEVKKAIQDQGHSRVKVVKALSTRKS